MQDSLTNSTQLYCYRAVQCNRAYAPLFIMISRCTWRSPIPSISFPSLKLWSCEPLVSSDNAYQILRFESLWRRLSCIVLGAVGLKEASGHLDVSWTAQRSWSMHHVRGALLLACSPCRLTRHADDFPLGESFGDLEILEKDGRQRVLWQVTLRQLQVWGLTTLEICSTAQWNEIIAAV